MTVSVHWLPLHIIPILYRLTYLLSLDHNGDDSFEFPVYLRKITVRASDGTPRKHLQLLESDR